MFIKKFRVTGNDVNDFMVMQNFAYHSYISTTLKWFLTENNYLLKNRKTTTIDIRQSVISISFQKALMFTQDFNVVLEVLKIDNEKSTICIKSRFYNINNKLCAIVISKFNCVGQLIQQPILLPKINTNPFLQIIV